MRRFTQYVFMASALLILGSIAGCNTDSVPPADGYYSASFTDGSGNVSTGYAIIDTSGAAVFVDQTSASITRFVIPSVDDNGNFTANTTTFTGSGSGVTAATGTLPVGGTVSATLNGSGGGGIGGGTASRNTITGTVTTTSGNETFTLTYQSNVYEDDLTSFSTIAISPNSGAAAVYKFNYTTTGSSTTSAAQLAFTGTTTTSTSGVVSYAFTSAVGSCNYTGTLSQPDSGYNAYIVNMYPSTGSCTNNLSGLAVYIPALSPNQASLTMEFDDSSSFAVAGNAALSN